jgi:ectoine hydroxylase-related dioxygenase (phytanoyl-CoA dioxygenase family)
MLPPLVDSFPPTNYFKSTPAHWQLTLADLTVAPSPREIAARTLSAASVKRTLRLFDEYGLAVVTDALGCDECADALRAELIADRGGSSTAAHRPREYIIERARRDHFQLNPFAEPSVSRIAVDLGLQAAPDWSRARGFLAQLIPARSSLTEIAAIVTHAGAKEQYFHADTLHRPSHARMVSVFVALQNVTDEMGPLHVKPYTHRYDFERRGAHYPTDGMRVLLPKGAMVLMDSRTVHRGSQHRGDPSASAAVDDSRAVFYVSWADPRNASAGGAQYLPEGATYAMLPEVCACRSTKRAFRCEIRRVV